MPDSNGFDWNNLVDNSGEILGGVGAIIAGFNGNGSNMIPINKDIKTDPIPKNDNTYLYIGIAALVAIGLYFYFK
jgi:hypothetical protein